MNKLLIILALSLFSLGCYTQNENKIDSVPHFLLRGVIVDSIDTQTIPGVLVSAIFETDTLHTTTNLNGLFAFKTQRQPQFIEATCLGYKITRIHTNKTSAIQDYGFIKMSSKDYALDEIQVTARLKKVVYRGDTVQFNANAFKTNKFATAGQLLSKMPGISVDEYGNVKYNGEHIAQAYIDGKKVFGEGYRNLLKYLEATDVKTIDVYKQLSEIDKHMGNEIAQKQIVLNFKTFSKLIAATVGHASVGYGSDEHRNVEGKKQDRYALGLTANFFSEKQSFQFNAFGNNVDRRSNTLEDIASIRPLSPGYNRFNAVSINGSKNIKKFYINVNYNYEEQYAKNLRRSEQIYTPTELFTSRITKDSTFSKSKVKGHNLNLSGSWTPRKLYLSYSINTSLRNSDSYNTMTSYISKDYMPLSEINTMRENNNKDISGDYSIGISYKLKPKINLKLDTRFSFNNNKGDGFQLDTAKQDVSHSYVDVTSNDKSTGYTLEVIPQFSYELTSHINTNFRLGMGKSRSNNQRYTIDNYTSEIDLGQTYHFLDNSETLTPRVGIDYRKRTHYLTASISGQFARQRQDDRLANTIAIPSKEFFAPLASASYNVTNIFDNRSNTFNFLYNTRAQIPGANMLRQTIDNRNPLYLRAGNKNLKQTYTHSLRSTLSLMIDEQNLRLMVTGNYTRNDIAANKTIFYDTETVLPEYNNFKVLAGSTLSTYDNIKEKYTIGIGTSYDRPADFIESLIKLNVGYSYSYDPRYISTELIKSYQHIPNAGIKVVTNISTDYEINMGYNIVYRDINRSNRTKDRLLQQQLNLSFDASLFKDILSLKTSYISQYSRNIDFRSSDFSSHILNLSIGCRLFKRKNGEVNLGVFDILNKNRSFASRANSEYLSNIWSQVSGRYAMINFSYRFNIKKSENKKINPGDYNSIINSPSDTY